MTGTSRTDSIPWRVLAIVACTAMVTAGCTGKPASNDSPGRSGEGQQTKQPGRSDLVHDGLGVSRHAIMEMVAIEPGRWYLPPDLKQNAGMYSDSQTGVQIYLEGPDTNLTKATIYFDAADNPEEMKQQRLAILEQFMRAVNPASADWIHGNIARSSRSGTGSDTIINHQIVRYSYLSRGGFIDIAYIDRRGQSF